MAPDENLLAPRIWRSYALNKHSTLTVCRVTTYGVTESPGIPAEGRRRSLTRLGLSVRELSGDLSARISAPRGLTGVMAWFVDAVGPAADADIERGDVILEINRRPVTSPADFHAAVAAARPGDILTVYLYKASTGQRRLATVRVDEP